jgi:hypothetical protein
LVVAVSVLDVWAETSSAKNDRLARVKKRITRECDVELEG